jgi:hypothetical protein
MADLQHATLSDSQLHYPKGTSGAANNTWLKANGDGTTSFASLPVDPVGSLSVVDGIRSSSAVAQYLSVNDTERQIAFSTTPVISANGSMSIDATGIITFNQAGVYHVAVSGNAGRTTSVSYSYLAFAARVNGVQAGTTTTIALDSAEDNFAAPISVSYVLEVPAPGVQVTYHMLALDVSGDSGIVPIAVAAAGWADVPSATISIDKLGVV